MTTDEFSNAFDVLLNSYNSLSGFGEGISKRDIVLDEYEKSIFLTEAQQQIVVELYSGRNDKGAPFEATEELRASLRNLIKTDTLEEVPNVISSRKTLFFKLPPDLLFITYELARILDDNACCSNGKLIEVVPVTLDSFNRIINNPFKGPNKRRALRVDRGSDMVEVYSMYHIDEYSIKYLLKPTPIVLANFTEVTIENGFDKITQCKLNSVVHGLILERAVQLAIRSKGISDKE